jgi:hypothetical protein
LADDNKAPRQKITIDKPKPASFRGDIVLACDSDKIEIWDASADGTQLALPKSFHAADLPKDLWVQGVKESDKMRDVTISVKADGKTLSSVKFTVLWVEQPTLRWSGQLSPKNGAKNKYKQWTLGGNIDLKFQRYSNRRGTSRWGFGTEASAAVHPSNFKYPGSHLMLDRDVGLVGYTGNVATVHSAANITIPPGNDNPPASYWALDNIPPTLFAVDAPGLAYPDTEAAGIIFRCRDNFRAYASVHVQGKDVRCSQITNYFVVLSMKQTATPTGTTWVLDNNVTGDNQVGLGTTKTTFDLK